jgi:glycogen debranching enzyme
VDDDVIQIAEHFYIRATSSRADDRTRVLKHGDTFGVFDRYGDVVSIGLGEQGLFHEGTRHLSRLELRLGRVRPLLLSSTVNEANDLFAVDLTNPDVTADDGHIVLPRGVLHVFRTKFIWQGTCYERLRISNYGMTPVTCSVLVRFEADFVDIFEVRGSRRERRGRLLEPHLAAAPDSGHCTLSYEGLDGKVRKTTLTLAPRPAELLAGSARFELRLPPQGDGTVHLAISCQGAPPAGVELAAAYDGAQAVLAAGIAARRRSQAQVSTSNDQFNSWLERSSADLQMMMTETPHGLYPYAGVPWFSTVFGRDGIITALQILPFAPEAARGVLGYLAATQADRSIPEQDAEPGKILHETRTGEMAALGEVPFGRYYGSVDATPLFVLLAGAYYRRTADRAFIATLWPHVERALRWMEGPGDPDGDGFVEYARRSAHGLVQQGWKDSHDSVFHSDGTMAEAPIALCEVQGYAFAARWAACELAAALGHSDRAEALALSARRLQEQFEEVFWCEDLGTYALALDGKKRPCRVRTSNAGHCLYTGIASPARARRTARTLLDRTSFSDWGIRTLASTEARYNPMSYHNGSIWPHDNALCAAGMARYGMRREALQVLDGLSAAAAFLDLRRMPELFCGFDRRPGEGPTLYPVACAPQSWAAGSVFMLLEACLGLSIDATTNEVRFEDPALPEWLPELRISRLEVAGASADFLLERHPHDVGVTVLRREGRLRVTVAK